MKKIFLLILRFLLCCFGLLSICFGLLGIILCTHSKNSFTLVMSVLFTVLFLLGGFYSLYSTFKKTVSTKSPSAYAIPSSTKPENDSPTSPAQYIESNNSIVCRADGKPISDKEIPYLIQVGLEQALKDEKESPNPKFHRTTHEEDLSFNFEMKYSHEIDNLTEKFEALYRESFETNNLEEKTTLLTEAILAFEKAKEFCYSKGKGGTIYFQDRWEYLHNSRTPCFSYLKKIHDALEETVYLKDEVIPAIIELVTKNDLILQKDIYKILPDIDKSTIQRTIKHLEANKIISRIKKGNSYELHILN